MPQISTQLVRPVYSFMVQSIGRSDLIRHLTTPAGNAFTGSRTNCSDSLVCCRSTGYGCAMQVKQLARFLLLLLGADGCLFI